MVIFSLKNPLSADRQTDRQTDRLTDRQIYRRIRAASNNVETIGGLLEGKLYAEPLNGAALQQCIDLLHPDSNDMDLLPSPEDDPYSEPP